MALTVWALPLTTGFNNMMNTLPPSLTSLFHLCTSPPSSTSFSNLSIPPPSFTSLLHFPPSPLSFTSLLHYPPSPPSLISLLNLSFSLLHLPPSPPSFTSLHHLDLSPASFTSFSPLPPSTSLHPTQQSHCHIHMHSNTHVYMHFSCIITSHWCLHAFSTLCSVCLLQSKRKIEGRKEECTAIWGTVWGPLLNWRRLKNAMTELVVAHTHRWVLLHIYYNANFLQWRH